MLSLKSSVKTDNVFVIDIDSDEIAPFYLTTIQNTVDTDMIERYVSNENFSYPV